jgi:hypothetical protein
VTHDHSSEEFREEALARQIRTDRSDASEPLVLTFANSAYTPLLRHWLRRTCQLGVRPCVIALDNDVEKTARSFEADVYRMEIGPGLPALWLRRVQLFRSLARLGVDFVHSDVDAIWLRNPVPFMLDTGADLVASQGTVWPPDVVDAWGFVLCCGLFLARGKNSVANLFDEVASRRTDIERGDDQAAFNRTLHDNSPAWDLDSTTPPRSGSWQGISFNTYPETVHARTKDLHVAMLPYEICPRLPEPPTGPAMVAHPLAPKQLDAKIALLEQLGLWSPSG